MATTKLNFLMPRLRLHIGDIDSSAYRYLDEWMMLSLLASVETLQRWWNFKYLTNGNDEVYRNPGSRQFVLPEPPVIEYADHRPIILMASIIIKSGSLENFSWQVGAWKDAEISFSNLEGSRSKQESIRMDWEEIKALLPPPNKKLTFSRKSHLPGYLFNVYEKGVYPDETEQKLD